MTIRVAGAQLAVSRDIDVNVAAITRALEFAAAEQADVLLTPEGSLSGYTPHFDREAASDALDHITALARVKGVGLALGSCYRHRLHRCPGTRTLRMCLHRHQSRPTPVRSLPV